MLILSGRAVSLLGASACGFSPVTLLPQESRTFHSNQPNRLCPINIKKQQPFRKEPYKMVVYYLCTKNYLG